MRACQECGEKAANHDLIDTDVGGIHRGECHMRALASLETVDLPRRLWAAVSLSDMHKPIHVQLTVPTKPTGKSKQKVTGVLLDHLVTEGADHIELWICEDDKGKMHMLPVILEMQVLEDAYAA